MKTITGLGQSNHRFLQPGSTKPCIVAGVIFDHCPGFQSKSDGDVAFHAICNALSSLSGVQVLGNIAQILCEKEGITDSGIYLQKAVSFLEGKQILHVALSLEAKRPYFQEHIPLMKQNIASILGIAPAQVGITAISGDGLTDVSCGDGVSCTALVSIDSESVHIP
jgi:2-C-methyl-D-erythritol 2,4-cyclodiphosphate synthase